MNHIKPKNAEGFTLVELAIVMIIIGLLVGGVIKGFQMVQNAKVKAIVSQLESIRASTQSFRDAYSALPGDLTNARDRVANCNDTTFCQNGNADSVVGTPGDNTAAAHEGENIQYWKHLSLANLLGGVVYDADPDAAPLEYAVHFPESENKKGGYQVFFRLADDFTNNHVIRLHSTVDATFSGTPGTYALTPSEIAQIDRTLDDSSPATGRIISLGAGGTASGCQGPGPYQEGVTRRNCILYMDMGF